MWLFFLSSLFTFSFCSLWCTMHVIVPYVMANVYQSLPRLHEVWPHPHKQEQVTRASVRASQGRGATGKGIDCHSISSATEQPTPLQAAEPKPHPPHKQTQRTSKHTCVLHNENTNVSSVRNKSTHHTSAGEEKGTKWSSQIEFCPC